MIKYIFKVILLLIVLMISTNTYAVTEDLEYGLISDNGLLNHYTKLDKDEIDVKFIAPVDATKISYTMNGISMGGISGNEWELKLDFKNTIEEKNEVMFFAYTPSGNKTYLYEFDVPRVPLNIPIEKSPRIKTTYKKQIRPTYEYEYIPILMYHSIPEGNVTDPSFQVSAKNFEAQIMTLIQNGYAPICFKDYERYKKGEAGLPVKPFIIAMDDGCEDNYTVAYPILKRMMAQATYFVNPAYMGKKIHAYPHFTWDNAKEMEASGLIDIQSHTYSHPDMSIQSADRIIKEIEVSFKLIEENLGERDIKVLCYPQYKSSELSRKIARDMGVIFQVTNLANRQNRVYDSSQLHRIHVKNTTTPQELINTIMSLTAK